MDEVLRERGADAHTVVARQVEARAVAVEKFREIAMRVALAIVAELVVEAFFQRAAGCFEHPHAPLAHDGGGVAGGLQELRDGDGVGRQRELALDGDFPVAAHGGVAAVETGHQRSAGGGADAGAAIRLGVARALAGHTVEPRGLDEFLTVGADVALSEVIAQNENDVRWGGCGGLGGADGEREGEKDEGGEETGGHGRRGTIPGWLFSWHLFCRHRRRRVRGRRGGG